MTYIKEQLVASDAIVAFARAMEAGGLWGDTENLLDFIEKPWKWDPEFEIWLSYASPTDSDTDDFDSFVEAVLAR